MRLVDFFRPRVPPKEVAAFLAEMSLALPEGDVASIATEALKLGLARPPSEAVRRTVPLIVGLRYDLTDRVVRDSLNPTRHEQLIAEYEKQLDALLPRLVPPHAASMDDLAPLLGQQVAPLLAVHRDDLNAMPMRERLAFAMKLTVGDHRSFFSEYRLSRSAPTPSGALFYEAGKAICKSLGYPKHPVLALAATIRVAVIFKVTRKLARRYLRRIQWPAAPAA